MEAQHTHGLGVEEPLKTLLGEQTADAVEEIRANNRADRRGDDDTGERHLGLRGEKARQRQDELAGDGREHVLEKDERGDRKVAELADEAEKCLLHGMPF